LIEIGWIYGCPFIVNKGGKDIGWIRTWFRLGQNTARGCINNYDFEIFVHKGNRISIRHKGNQVGIIQRESWKEWEGDKYHAEFDDDLNPEVCSICLLFTDLVWFTSDASAHAKQKTEYIPIRGVEEIVDWHPKKGI